MQASHLVEELNFNKQQVKFPAQDGYLLTGYHYSPLNPSKAKIILCSATGVPQPFYRRFCEYVVQFGYEILSFDYRGIAESAPEKMKGFEMQYLDWGILDLTGAIDFFSENTKDLFLVGHSFGGQALGLCSNHQKVKAMYCFGTGAGWAGYMPFKEKFKVSVMWNIVFPPLIAVKGYLPWSKFNMGADLPLGVYVQWKKWCKSPKYFFADPDLTSLVEQYARVKTKIYAVSALDDDWALPNSRHAFMQHYQNADIHYIDITASQYGMKKIGHMGYFKKGSENIWDFIIHGFDQLLNNE